MPAPKRRSWSYLGPFWPLRSMWKSLPCPQRLRVAGRRVHAGHLLVPDLRVHADQLRPLEPLDEGERVPDRGEQDVAAGLVGLGLDREAEVVALLGDVVAEQVEGLLHPVQRDARVLRGAVLRALTTAPGDVDLGAQLGGEVDVAHHLAQREAADVAVVVGEAAGLEDGVAEEVGGRGRDHEAGVGEALLEAGDDRVAGCVVAAERDHVVVVEVDAVGAEAGELLKGVDGVHRRAGGAAERVDPLPADGPETEGELVLGGRGGDVGAHGVLPSGWSRGVVQGAVRSRRSA